ncbi:MAG: hypothetical protein ACRD2C_14400 [Acidimicrobiales bacterium]
MLLTITTTQRPATDLSRLLLADPDDVRTCRFAFGEALVFFPQHDSARCTAAVLVQPSADQLRTPLASLALVLATVFETAIRDEHPDPAAGDSARHFEVQAPARPCGDLEDRARRLFAPLGYDLELGADGSLWLSTTTDLASLLTHLCVLLPVVEGGPVTDGHEIVERLPARAGGWLAAHPEYGLIAREHPELSAAMPPAAPRHQIHKPRICTRHLAN